MGMQVLKKKLETLLSLIKTQQMEMLVLMKAVTNVWILIGGQWMEMRAMKNLVMISLH